MINQLNISSSPYFSTGSKIRKYSTSNQRLDDNPSLPFTPKQVQSDVSEDYFVYTQTQKSTGNINYQADMRTRSSSESTTLSLGIHSPKSGTFQTQLLENQDTIGSEELASQGSNQISVVPSTPFLHKYKTELCKNWEIEGNCIFGDRCSFAHGQRQLQTKIDLPSKYKTRMCKKFQEELYCPYGIRCQFIHSIPQKASDQQESEFLKNPQNPQVLQPQLNPTYSDILTQNLFQSMQAHLSAREFYGRESDIKYLNIFNTKRLQCFSQITNQGINNNLVVANSSQCSQFQAQSANYSQKPYLQNQQFAFEINESPDKQTKNMTQPCQYFGGLMGSIQKQFNQDYYYGCIQQENVNRNYPSNAFGSEVLASAGANEQCQQHQYSKNISSRQRSFNQQ
ncbi:zinc finger protein [Stylonychia lemnae]|uniref:Zinc finger protein n=1 Tax=Stylonychia lemnae TaxID=5949 RepID=A0A078AXP8_STYLE|nr:zinc finger protein [Stylonychia lemnae]|eukprot:CDW86841.1 zinc finger protein [Stylonychia lemnae]